jgi:glycosyltransferase involved in cell wall biosynthesis
MAPAAQLPSVSVVIRSYNRLDCCIELLESVLAQGYSNFEVVVVEQSSEVTPEQTARLAQLEADPRVRILRSGPLGAAGARNAGWKSARNEVVLYIDDDDLPLDRDWIQRHAENYLDPLCVGVSGRQVHARDEDPTPFNTERSRHRCLRYTYFKMPRGDVHHTMRIPGVTMVHGTNASIRRSVIERLGGWDELTESTDENSFDFRFDKAKEPGQYLLFDPLPVVLRRLDQPGGLDRRQASLARLLSFELNYSHRLVRRYYPLRFYALYPCYLWLAAYRAVDFVSDHHRERSRLQILGELVRVFAPSVANAWR